jgi:hypothetical protein
MFLFFFKNKNLFNKKNYIILNKKIKNIFFFLKWKFNLNIIFNIIFYIIFYI